MAARKTPAVKAEAPKEIEGADCWGVWDYENGDFMTFSTKQAALSWVDSEDYAKVLLYRIYARTKSTIELVTV